MKEEMKGWRALSVDERLFRLAELEAWWALSEDERSAWLYDTVKAWGRQNGYDIEMFIDEEGYTAFRKRPLQSAEEPTATEKLAAALSPRRF